MEVDEGRVRIQRGQTGVRTPQDNHKAIRFICNTGPDPLENHVTTMPAFYIVGQHLPASETPFKWRFAVGPAMARI